MAATKHNKIILKSMPHHHLTIILSAKTKKDDGQKQQGLSQNFV